MANKTIEINVKVNGIDTIKGQVDDLQKQLEAIGDIELISDEAGNKIKKITKQTEDLGKTGKQTGVSIGSIAKGFGLMKIGEAILGKLSDLFMENATVARAMDIATRALSIVFKDFFNFISDNIGNVIQAFKDVFENPQKSIEQFGTLIKENIEERISSAIDLFGYLASSVKKVFSGDFAGAMEDAKKAGKEFVDVQTGINNSVDRAIETVGEVAGAISDYTKKVTDLATAQIDAENASKIASALAKGRVADLEAEAEQLRQVRDNTLLSVADRIKANDKLKGKLEELRQAKLAETQADVLIAKNALALNATTENKVALINAESTAKQANADITGQLSEQEQNRSQLLIEQNQLNQTAINGLAERAIAEKQFTAGLIVDTTDRLEAQKQALIDSQKLEEDRLNEIVKTSKEGTQARADAEQAILASRQKLNQDLITNEKETNLQLKAEHDQHITATIEDDTLSFETRFQALDEQLTLINQKQFESEEAHTAAVKENTDKRNALTATQIDVQNAYLDATASVIDGLGSISKEGGDVQKAFAVSSAIINTYTAIAGQLAAFSGIPVPGFAIAQAIATGIFGLLQVKKIIETKPGQTKSASVASKPLAPSFNLNGQNNNQNTTSADKTTEVNTQNQQITVKAYVSETEMTQKQGFIKKVGESAKI